MAADSKGRAHRGASRRGRRGFRWRGLFLGLVVPALVTSATAILFLYVEITSTFEGRLWALPSRIYSRRLTLKLGDPLTSGDFARHLERLGYVRIEGTPQRPGQFRRSEGTVEVHLRSFEAPTEPLFARRVKVRFEGHRVSSLEDERGRRLNRVDSEPALLALLFGSQREERQPVRLEDVPRHLIDAVLAAEDSRFYRHMGFDPLSILRAVLANVREGRIVQGGSTIPQQTVKNLYLGQDRTWWRKLRELPMAFILDARYSKERILGVYLNEVYLGQRGSVAVCGVQSAARFYFGRDARDLSLSEAALLAGMIRNPGGYNPFVHRDRALARRAQVLDRMVEEGMVSSEDAERARKEALRLTSRAAAGPHASYLVDFIRSQLSRLYPAEILSEEGLKVFTTVDPFLQDSSEKLLRSGLVRLERDRPSLRRRDGSEPLQGCAIVLDPATGAIRALVGGRDYRSSQFNRAVQARRQPGSCFKPFVYLAGLEASIREGTGGFTAATVLEDEPLTLRSGGRTWAPRNYDGEFRGRVTVRTALENSLNVPTVRAALQVGLDAVVAQAAHVGFTSAFEPLPSLALGAQEVTPLELAGAYGCLANGGVRVEPVIIEEVATKDGRRLERSRAEQRRGATPIGAFLITDLLRGVLLRGTASTAWSLGLDVDAAGKTGTTDDTRDAWFVGYTPRVLGLVWVGYDDGAKTGLTGASGALPIWVDLIRAAEPGGGGAGFVAPEGIVRVAIDPESGLLAARGCPTRTEEVFAQGTEPAEECPLHATGFRRWLRNLFGGGQRREAHP